jgi:hypothetical protein
VKWAEKYIWGLVGKPERKSLIGRYRLEVGNNIKEDL